MRIVPEGTKGAWPGDNVNNCKNGYNCPDWTLSLNNFDVFRNRYIDVGAGGPASFDFTVSSNASWVKLSEVKGKLSKGNPEKRIWVSVGDWGKLSNGPNAAVLTFRATAKGFQPLNVNVNFVATKRTVPSGFKGTSVFCRGCAFICVGLTLVCVLGFVEGAGVISIEAAHSSRQTPVDGIAWTELPGLGRTLSAITPKPRIEKKFEPGTGPSV